MKKLLSIVAVFALCVCTQAAQSQITFTENTDIFPNPGQGWERFSIRNTPSKNKVNFGAGYSRFLWRDLEPEEGKYNWKLIDDAIASFSKDGLPFYFRIMCVSSSGYPEKLQWPKWVMDKGAKYHEVLLDKPANVKYPDGKVPYIVPEFADPIFMAAHENFIKALAARYDGDPRIGAIDLGSYGNWGEWHCACLGLGNYGGHRSPHTVEVRKKWGEMYMNNFKKTQIVSIVADPIVLEENLGKGIPRVGLRSDGIGDPNNFHLSGAKKYERIKNMGEVWKYCPMVFESIYDVNGIKAKGWDVAYALNWMLENHVSIVNEGPLQPHQVVAGSPEEKALRQIDLYAGARLVPQTADVVYHNGKLDIKIRGVNKGVARIYLPYKFVYEIRDASGKVVAKKTSKTDPRSILPGEFEIADSFNFSLKNGQEYKLSLRVRNKDKVFRDFRFAAKNLNADGSLDLGTIKL